LTVALGVLVNPGQYDLRHRDVDLFRWAQVLLNRYIHNSPYPTCKLRVLSQAVDAALRAAHQNDIRTMAMPAIGTGVFAFPPELAADITAKVLMQAATLAPHLQCLRLCVPSDFLRDVYSAALEAKGLRVSQVESAPV
jgi:hypothetical protein